MHTYADLDDQHTHMWPWEGHPGNADGQIASCSDHCTLSKEVNMADTSFVMLITTNTQVGISNLRQQQSL